MMGTVKYRVFGGGQKLVVGGSVSPAEFRRLVARESGVEEIAVESLLLAMGEVIRGIIGDGNNVDVVGLGRFTPRLRVRNGARLEVSTALRPGGLLNCVDSKIVKID